jgi:small subunit ribosomal protein S8
MLTDPIADMLTRIRNALSAKQEVVDVPASRMKASIVKILRDEGFIESFRLIRDGNKAWIKINLKYDSKGKPAIQGIRRVSKPGLRRYVAYDEISNVRNGIGLAIISTSKGILSNISAKNQKLGGEYICEVW